MKIVVFRATGTIGAAVATALDPKHQVSLKHRGFDERTGLTTEIEILGRDILNAFSIS
jgi:hypothetical protein